jgi:very-short-patch-repair endonuclease
MIHDFTVERDERRDDYMRGLGLSILRVPARDVMADVWSIADGLVRLCAGPSTIRLR